VVQSTSLPDFDRQTRLEGMVPPVSSTRSAAFCEVTDRTSSLKEMVTEPPIPVGVASAATGGVVSGEGMVTGPKSSPLNQSTSTQPGTPGTFPQSEYCQNVHPWPSQSFAGTVGVVTPQC